MNQQLQSIAIFKPLLQTFCEQTMQLQMDDNFSTLCLPHTMKYYASTSRKIFYFGRDTNSWCKTGLLRKCYEWNILEKYLEANAAFLNDYEFLFYNNNASYGFWSLVVNLHLRLKGVKEYVQVDKHFYDSDYMDLINDFGYGNTNSIELKASLINQGLWKSKDVSNSMEGEEMCAQLDKLKCALDVNHPNLDFIFSRSSDDAIFLLDIRYKINPTNLFHADNKATEFKEPLISKRLQKPIDIFKYSKIKDKSTQMDKLKYTLDAYHPDLIFIFNWSADHTHFLEGLRYTINKTNLVNGYFWVIDLLDYPTRIIWTLHPRSLIYNRLNIHNFIDEILTQVEL